METITTAAEWNARMERNTGREAVIVVHDDGRTVDATMDKPSAEIYAAVIGAPSGWSVQAIDRFTVRFAQL